MKGHYSIECMQKKNKSRVEDKPAVISKGKQRASYGHKQGGKPQQVKKIAGPGPSSQQKAHDM